MSRPAAIPFKPARLGALAWACALAIHGTAAHADERAELEKIRVTTQSLIQALVDSGLLPREKADAILKQAAEAGEKAAAAVLDAKPVQSAEQATPSKKPNVIHIPYLSETTKAELREQVKQEVLAQAHEERWGEPGALPTWLNKITFFGDLRVRYQHDGFDQTNTPYDDPYYGYQSQAISSLAWSPDLVNTLKDRNRLTERARVGLIADLGDGYEASVRLSTGNGTSPVSASQTQGNYFNKYGAFFDQAYIGYNDHDKFLFKAGRFAPPFFGSDLTWPDDLNLDGAMVTYKSAWGAGQSVFFTAGAFPLKELEMSAKDPWLYGAQMGAALPLGQSTVFRAGVTLYNFDGIEGRTDTRGNYDDSLVVQRANYPDYAQTEYPVGVRQHGNTLIRLNNPQGLSDDTASIWGLASRFRPLDLNAEFAFLQFFPITVKASFDFIKNLGFDLQDIRSRSGQPDLQLAKQNTAVQAKFTVGYDKIEKAGQWQSFLAFRRMERDAWVDAFTDNTIWNLGGTNYQGWSIGGQYGIGPRTSLGFRYTSTHSLHDSTQYPLGLSNSATLNIDLFLLELNTRF